MKAELVQTGQILRDLRESQTTLMPEQIPAAMLRAGISRDRIPGSRTIRRIENGDVWPRLRYRAGLAEFYDREMHQLWPTRSPKR